MTCTTCSDLEIAATRRTPGLAARLLPALARPWPARRLDLDSLSRRQLRDLGLADGRELAPRDSLLD